MKYLILLTLAVPTFSFATPPTTCKQIATWVAGYTSSTKLDGFFKKTWNYVMVEHPEYATYVGYPGQNDRLTDISLEANERRRANTKCLLKTLQTIPTTGLNPQELVSYQLAKNSFELDIEGDQFPDEYMPINQRDGIQLDITQLMTSMPKNSAADFNNILKRLELVPKQITDTQILMREGLKKNVTPVKSFMEKVLPQIDQLTATKVEDSPLFESFKEFGIEVSTEQKAQIQNSAKEIIQTKVYPAFISLKVFLQTEYIPKCREFTAFSDLPNGKAWYAFRIKSHTTTTKSADELHELGLKEVERITKEMDTIRQEAKFKGDLKAFNKFLLTDKRFHYNTPEELLSGYRDIAKRVDAELPRLFKTLPRMTYGIRAIPEYAAPTAAGAQYTGGSLEAGRAGFFEANTYDLSSRPKWDMETLTFHEAVPGHHFQIARASELEGLPEFRKRSHYTAYTEGWALYAESLGYELGFFKDPYSKYGNLSAEMMRAARLVVDTGLHAKGWSKEKALNYFRSVFPVSDTDSLSEIERYISWPGQALAYKVGQLKIRELRSRAKQELGDAFDVREFHDEILRHGALPLDVLDKNITIWSNFQKKKISKKL